MSTEGGGGVLSQRRESPPLLPADTPAQPPPFCGLAGVCDAGQCQGPAKSKAPIGVLLRGRPSSRAGLARWAAQIVSDTV